MARELRAFGWKWLEFGVVAGLFAACSSEPRQFTIGSGGSSTAGAGASEAAGEGGVSSDGPVASAGSNDEAGSGGVSNDGTASGGLAGAGGNETTVSASGAAGESGRASEGQACATGLECESGHCRDEVCCATVCDGACEACAEALTGQPSGTCANVASGTDPHDDCESSSAESCGQDGECDGQGACRNYGTNQVCQPASCSNSTYYPASTCDGEGACGDQEAEACGEYPCSAEGCQTPCAEDTDCPAQAYCAAEACRNKKTDGDACSEPGECRSGACVDGVCCQSACSLSCQACSKATTGLGDGICGARTSSASKPCTSGGTTSCVDVTSNVDHCGACGAACPESPLNGTAPVCSASKCSLSCPAGTLGDGSNVCIPVTTVGGGVGYACGLLADGHVKCWGDTTNRGLNPTGLSNVLFKTITVSSDFACGIRENGAAYCWGNNPPPVKAGTFYALAAGDNHVCGIKSDRTLDCWTRGDTGTTEPPTGTYKWLASGTDYSCAILQGGSSDGRGACWGNGTELIDNYPEANDPETWSQMWGAGLGAWGVRADGSTTNWGKILFTPPNGSVFKALSHGASQNRCGILMDGSLTCWGTPGSEATIPPSGTFTAIGIGGGFACGVKTGGAMMCWGSNDAGQAPNSVSGTFQGYW